MQDLENQVEIQIPKKSRGNNPASLANLRRGNTFTGGRPKSLQTLIRERTDDGKELVETMLQIVRGELEANDRKPSHRDIVEAAQWLSDRGFGKAVETSINLDLTTDSNALASVVARQLLNLGAEIPEEPAPPQIEV